MSRVLTVIGTRPQYIKYAALSRGLRRSFEEVLVDTGQHYDRALSGLFLDELQLPVPDVTLEGGGGTAASQLSRMLDGLQDVIDAENPAMLLTFGDTVSTLAAALSAVHCSVPLIHVEAGERSRDAAGTRMPPWSSPEEFHRVTTDSVSSLLLCATEGAAESLRSEGAAGEIRVTGDIMYDLFLQQPAGQAPVLADLGLPAGEYLYCTVHRQRNTESAARLREILAGVLSSGIPVVLPLHPRTRIALERGGLLDEYRDHDLLRLIEPVGYAASIALARNARRIVTDSGGLTREAYFCGVPSVCVDDSTAWHQLCTHGWCSLTGAKAEAIRQALGSSAPTSRPPLFGSGDAAEQTIAAIRSFSTSGMRPSSP